MSHSTCNVQILCLLFVSSIHLGNLVHDDSSRDETPIIQKGAAFIYNYHAFTSESESKVRVFSPFPQPPAVDLKAASTLIETVNNVHNHMMSLPFVNGVVLKEPCPVSLYPWKVRADGLKETLEHRIQLLEKEQLAIADDYAELLRVASSFAAPPMDLNPSGSNHHRSKRLVPALMAASGVAGLVLGNPVRNAACKALSIFSLCSDNSGLKRNVQNLLQG